MFKDYLIEYVKEGALLTTASNAIYKFVKIIPKQEKTSPVPSEAMCVLENVVLGKEAHYSVSHCDAKFDLVGLRREMLTRQEAYVPDNLRKLALVSDDEVLRITNQQQHKAMEDYVMTEIVDKIGVTTTGNTLPDGEPSLSDICITAGTDVSELEPVMPENISILERDINLSTGIVVDTAALNWNSGIDVSTADASVPNKFMHMETNYGPPDMKVVYDGKWARLKGDFDITEIRAILKHMENTNNKEV